MPFQRLPETVHTLYAELLDQVIRAEAELPPDLPRQGSFVSKLVKGRRYWYLQRVEGDRRRQHYLGPESEQLLGWMREVGEQRRRSAPDAARRAELVEMLVAGGAGRESAPVTKVLAILADSGVFRLGAVVVGTQAFTCYANLLGIRFEKTTTRTQDIDLAHDSSVGIALAPEPPQIDVLATLQQAEPAFVAVPELDPRSPSTSFKVRGRDLRVDILTPARGRATESPVWIPWLRTAATPLPFLGYLIEETVQVVLLGGSGVLLNVPPPGRFALHKLWLARQRPIAEQARSRKDVQQATQLLEVLLADRPEEIRLAWAALERRPRERSAVRRALVEARDVESIAGTGNLLGLR
jgi:hypothetical protein